MTSPTGSDQHYPQGGAPGGQPAWGAPTPGGYDPAPAASYAGAPAGPMPFADAVRSVLTQYATFTGRARRSEYWFFVLAYFIAAAVAAIIDGILGATILGTILGLGLLIPTIALSVRRLHDIGKSGWWLLLGLIPLVGAIVLLVFSCQDSQRGTNQWGPSPKYGA